MEKIDLIVLLIIYLGVFIILLILVILHYELIKQLKLILKRGGGMGFSKNREEVKILPQSDSGSLSSEKTNVPDSRKETHKKNIVGLNCKFDIEILCSPAQRVSGDPSGPQPLAEDVTSIKFLPPHFLMGFVADGAPSITIKINEDKDIKHSLGYESGDNSLIFGSREMAKLIGRKVFFKCILNTINDKKNLNEGWIKIFTDIFKEQLRKEMEEIFSPLLGNIPSEKFNRGPNNEQFVQFQVSFAGFLLNLIERKLFLFMPGDTKACIGMSPEEYENSICYPVKTSNPIFFRIIKTVNNNQETEHSQKPSIVFKPIIDKPTIEYKENVLGIMIMSDGVVNDKILKEKCTPDNLFKDVCNSLKKLDFRSADDKALLIVSLEGNDE